MYVLPALGVVMVVRAYWRMNRDSDARRVKEWDEFRRGDERVTLGERTIRLVAWFFAIWRRLLGAGALVVVGLVLFAGSMEWERAPWRLPLAWILVTAGLCAWAYGKNYDPANGRRRCPKCWYDYSALGGTDTCPECGHEPRNLAELRRTRPSRGWMMATPLFLVLAYLTHMLPIVARTSWRSFVPTDVLVWGYDVLPDTLIVGPEPGSLVERFDFVSTWFFLEERVWRMGVRAMVEGRSVAALERAALFGASGAIPAENDAIMRNIARVVANEVEAGTATVATSNSLLAVQKVLVLSIAPGEQRSAIESNEVHRYGVIIAKEPTAKYAYILSIALAYFNVDDERVFALVEAVVRDPNRTDADRIAAAAHLGLLCGGSGVAVGLPEAELTAYRTVAEVFAAEQLGRSTAFYEGMTSLAGPTYPENKFAMAARDAFSGQDMERMRGAIMALEESWRAPLPFFAHSSDLVGLGRVASEHPELRKSALILAAKSACRGDEYDPAVLAGLQSSDAAERVASLHILLRRGTPLAGAAEILERLKDEVAIDPTRKAEADLIAEINRRR